MSIFNTSDKLEEIGFINKDDILKYVTEEQIFSLVFGFEPKEYDFVVSPFRKDNNPGCWFNYSSSGKLRLSDFGNTDYYGKIKLNNIDCFDAVQVYFKLNNLYQTLKFIRKHLILGKDLPEMERKTFLINDKKKRDVLIHFDARLFNKDDGRHWSRFEITSNNLLEDQVFAVKRFKVTNTKNGDWNCRIYDLCYAYTEFENGKKKLYRPYQKGKNRFITNTTNNDIGGLHTLDTFGDLLVITKSYKDWRVLRNQGVRNVIWFQNEGMIPSDNVLIPIISRFKRVSVFFDNDNTGILQSQKVSNLINSYTQNKSSHLYLPEFYSNELISDPGDLIWKKGKVVLNNFLYQNGII